MNSGLCETTLMSDGQGSATSTARPFTVMDQFVYSSSELDLTGKTLVVVRASIVVSTNFSD